MAVAARPGASDARVPCPLCGGLIHPIAGKCKHCKADLTAYHSARPAASTPLPSLHKPAVANGHSTEANGQAAHAAVATAVAPAHEAQPVLPPRPTVQSATVAPRGSVWRSWPVLVIVLAMITIVAAVVLMVWPASAARAGRPGKQALQPPPAPERMPTTVPDVDRRAPDRHNQAAPPRATPPDPWAPPGVQAPGAADPDADDDLAPADPSADPFASPHASGGLRLNRPGTLFAIMVVHLCRKMIECGVDDPIVTNQCDRFSQVAPPTPANCPAATRCLQRIDGMACGTQPATLSHVAALLNQFSDCHDAIRC